MKMYKIKRIATLLLAVCLAAVFTLESPLQVFAESKFSLGDYTTEQLEEMIDSGSLNTGGHTLYISDLVMVSDSSEEAAKKALRDAGYIVYDANLNEGAGSDYAGSASTVHYTYLGYKLTDKKEEGITGLATMDQNGGYEKFNYRDFVEGGMPRLGDQVECMEAICKEFKAQLDKGSYAARVAKERLDCFCVPATSKDKTGPKLGDYLIDPNRTSDDFNDMTLALNSLILDIINDELNMGIADSVLKESNAYKGYKKNTTWLEDALGAVAASRGLETIAVKTNGSWTAIEAKYGKEAEALRKSFAADANDTAKSYLDTVAFDLTIDGKRYQSVEEFLMGAPIRAIALFASELPEVCLGGRFADILNRFAAAPTDGIPAGLYTSYTGVVSYAGLVDNKDWIRTAYNSAKSNKMIASINVENSEYWLKMQNIYGAELTTFRNAVQKGKVSTAAVNYLKTVIFDDGTDAYTFLTTCEKRMGAAFFYAMSEQSNTKYICDRFFLDILEVCASDYLNRIPTGLNINPTYTVGWVENVRKSINEHPYNSSTEKELYDASQKMKTEIDVFYDLLHTFVTDYKDAKKKAGDKNSYDLKSMTTEENNKMLDDLADGKINISETKMPNSNYIFAAEAMEKYTLNNGKSLFDYLLEIDTAFQEEKSTKGYALAYPFVNALTKGQRYVYRTRSFLSFLMTVYIDEFDVTIVAENHDYEKVQYKSGFGEGLISIWYASNKDLLEHKGFIATTNDKVRAAAAENDFNSLMQNPPNYVVCKKVLLQVVQVLSFSLMVAPALVGWMAQIMGVGFFSMIGSVFSSAAVAGGVAVSATVATVTSVVSTIAVGLVIVVAIVLIVVALIYLFLYMVEYYSHPYTDQPTLLLDCQTTENNNIVQDSIVKYFSVNDLDGKPADANALNGKKWTTLYYTKDTRLGSPLTAGPKGQFFMDQKGGYKAQEDALPIAKFGDAIPYDMNTNCFKNTIGGHYFWYYTEESMDPNKTDEEKELKYISDVIIVYAEEPSVAQLAITRLSGYSLFNVDLSPDAEYRTYLGYKKTSDTSRALTDIRVSYASASGELMYGGAKYSNVQTVDRQTITAETCEPQQSSRQTTSFSYGVYTSISRLVGDPILADTFSAVTKVGDIPANSIPISMFAGGPFDFDSWDAQSYYTFGNHKFVSYKTEPVKDKASETSGTSGTSETSETGKNTTTTTGKNTTTATGKNTTTATGKNTTTTTGENATEEPETYLAGIAFFSGSYDDWMASLSDTFSAIDAMSSLSLAEKDPTEYAKSQGYTILEWWDPTKGYTYSTDRIHLAIVTTQDPKRALTDIGVFTAELKSPYLPDAINTAAGGYCACQVYTQGNGDYYGAKGPSKGRSLRKSHAYITGTFETEINHYTTDGKALDLIKGTRGARVTRLLASGDRIHASKNGIMASSRALYAAGPVEGKKPLRLSDIIFSLGNARPYDGADNSQLFYLTEDGVRTACESSVGTGWKSVHPLDQYYYDTYDAKGNITSSFNLGSSQNPLCIFYKDRTPNRVQGNYVAKVEIVGSQTKNASYNTARFLGMAYGTDIINLRNPIQINTEKFYDPVFDDPFMPEAEFASVEYSDGAIYVTVSYTNDAANAVGSIRILEQTTKKLSTNLSMPLEASDLKASYRSGDSVAPYFQSVEDEEKDPNSAKITAKEKITEGLVVYTTPNGLKTNRLSLRTIPIAATPEVTGGTANEFGKAEYFVPFGSTGSDPFLLANYRIGKAFCLCAERTDVDPSNETAANFKYIESISVITDKSFDGSVSMAATTLGASGYPFVINYDVAGGALRSGDNRVMAIGVKRTGNENAAIKDIKLSAVDYGVAYEYLGRSYTRANDIPVNGMFIYTTKNDGTEGLLDDYIDWSTVNVKTTNFQNFDFTKLNWNTIDDSFNYNWLPPEGTPEMAEIEKVQTYQKEVAEAFAPKLSAITNLGFIPLEGSTEGSQNGIFWAGRASKNGAQTIVPVTDKTGTFDIQTFDGTLSGLKLVYTNGANKNYDDFIAENKKDLPPLVGAAFADSGQLMPVIVLSSVAIAATALALIVGLKRKKKAKQQ